LTLCRADLYSLQGDKGVKPLSLRGLGERTNWPFDGTDIADQKWWKRYGKMGYMIESVQVQGMQGKAPAPGMKNANAPSGFQEELQRQINSGETQRVSSSAAPSGHGGVGTGLIHVGAISRENPTVSHLLISHPDYRSDCWKIIHSEVNAQKAFRTLREGEDIFIDSTTHEVVWDGREISPFKRAASDRTASSRPAPGESVVGQRQSSSQESRKVDAVIARAGADSGSLATVLSQHIGTPYERLDCYELVVEGLKEMGVRYGGKGGLQGHLIHAAVEEGLPMNAYLTGDGLIEASSTTVFKRTITELEGIQGRAGQIWEDLEPRLEQGLIVSFSTGDRGHTGVVSRYGETWTLLNSGDIDNDVRSGVRRKGVGEEDLRSEISNWLRLAERRGKPLSITLGRLNRDKLVSFLGDSSSGRVA
jgi:hypothetical protein